MYIHGVEEADQIEWVKVFHSGTRKKDGKLVAHGGRVLGITAHSTEGIEDARRIAYDAAEKISVEGGFHFRKDIASKAL